MPRSKTASLNCRLSTCLGARVDTIYAFALPGRGRIPYGRSIGSRSGGERQMSVVTIQAPFDGWCTGLDEVPDPVFSGPMLGDGVAIDPVSGILLAPCAG